MSDYYTCAYQYYSHGEPNFESGRYVTHTSDTLQEAVLHAFNSARRLCEKGDFDEGLCSVCRGRGAPLYWIRPKSSWLRRGVEIQSNKRPAMRAIVVPVGDFDSYAHDLKQGTATLP